MPDHLALTAHQLAGRDTDTCGLRCNRFSHLCANRIERRQQQYGQISQELNVLGDDAEGFINTVGDNEVSDTSIFPKIKVNFQCCNITTLNEILTS